MFKRNWMTPGQSAALFGAQGFHIPVALAALARPRLLWLNEACARHDPCFAALHGDLARYEAHLLRTCAYRVVDEQDKEACVMACADRYGGSGIGLNGGSGRAVVCGNYHVKGVGRTPLVSALTPQAHASGGAYLEECVREAIFSEIARHEFPASAIPVLAIIDTGLVQVWETEHGPKHERRTLLVRPNVVRPAHFARATGFWSGDPREGSRDQRRVAAFFAHTQALFGHAALADALPRFWQQWARQLAYAFIHRMPHGSNTISNISMDGALLDFGASSALPSWASIATMQSPQPFAGQFAAIRHAVRELSYYFGRYVDGALGEERHIQAQCQAAQHRYRVELIAQALRLCGVGTAAAQLAAEGGDHALLWRSLSAVIAHFQREAFDLRAGLPPPGIPWDVHQVWSRPAPAHLRQWQRILRDYVGAGEQALAEARCAALARSRPHLYREDAKSAIYQALAAMQRHETVDARDQVSSLIRGQIARGRRDTPHLADGDTALGFAVNAASSYLLYRHRADGKVYAREELSHDGEGAPDPGPLPVQTMSAHGVTFQQDCHPPLRGAVALAGDDGPAIQG
ncbi:hypothetical protein [Duganella radicis]|uniref:hypothetical protein n=1 Tax=Duganella radicis TaxID=551988 RepID=UPI001478B2F9|nr:hypothetical protein [Duganella radicis]